MDRKEYEEVLTFVNSFRWRDYASNLRAIMVSAKNKFNLSTEDLLEFEGNQRIDSINKREFGNNTDCIVCNGRGYMHTFKVVDKKIYYIVKDCICKSSSKEES